LPSDWSSQKKDKVMALSNADDKWTQRVIAHVNNMLDWLEVQFGYVGPGEYVRMPIVRICKTSDERDSFLRGVSTGGGWGWSTSDAELVTCMDDTGWTGREVDLLNRQVIDYWFREKNVDLLISMPDWLQSGLYEAVEGARMDGRKPEFKRDFYNMETFREAERAGTLTEPKALFVMTAEDFHDFQGSAAGFWNRRAECQLLVSFLISDEAKRVRQAKGLLQDYMTNLIAVLDEAEEEFAGDLKKKLVGAEDEEEEKRIVTELRSAMRKREKTILERTFERSFAKWSDRDWDSFTKGMRAGL